MTQTEQIQQLLKEVVECEEGACVDRIISTIASLPEDAETHYALRYCYYVHRGREHSPHIRDLVDRHLDTALELGGFDFHASLYRGHNAYDFPSFDVAATFFDRARRVAPKNYIGLKAFEMEACTALSRGHFAEFVEKAKAFAEEAERLDYEVEDLWQRELVKALAQHASSMPGKLRTAARDHLASIDARGRLNGWLVEALDGVEVLDVANNDAEGGERA